MSRPPLQVPPEDRIDLVALKTNYKSERTKALVEVVEAAQSLLENYDGSNVARLEQALTRFDFGPS